jgi:O-antigen/teichoic acid export membrane protein
MAFKQTALGAIKWSFLGQYAEQLILFLISIVLARLLEPRDFGLIAMLGFFSAVISAIGDFGIGNGLIQKKNATEADKATVFWVSIAMGLVMATMYWSIAGWVADFYNEPQLKLIIQISALVMVFDSLTGVQRVLIKKEIRFKRLALIRACATLGAGMLGVGLAWMGCGVWSLVVQGMASTLLLSLGFWMGSSWRPSFCFSLASIRSLAGFSLHLFGANFVDYVVGRVDSLVAGKLFAADLLGFYNRASSLTRLPVQYAIVGLQRTLFPLFASISDDKAQVEAAYRKATEIAGFWVFAISFGLAAVAEPLIVTVYGEKWKSAAPLLKILALSGPFLTWTMIQTSFLLALGRARQIFHQSLARSVILIGGLVVGSFWGLEGMCWGRLLTELITVAMRCRDVEKALELPWFSETVRMLRPLASSVVMLIAVWACAACIPWSDPFELLFLVPLGGVVYLAMAGLTQRKALIDSFRLLALIRPSSDKGRP